ncbi:uncharacterized protein si:ch211-127m7.2 [Astyanax mexicanus]|uniref:uncharacterized protein si:ch211-127m7.2 n=1 Tax=Astyanax mexicanus TaxID=7994 RepID=UPI0020CB1720|nr:uncharacterized protein si:ch211-127m7.2 [Astyanax mexicanus]
MAAKRSLPSWMCARDSGSSAGRERTGVNREKRPERTMLYWMNERELVETALSVLMTNTVKTGVACPAAAAEVSVIPETDTEEDSDLDAKERSCGSDSDVDVAEQQTVPYITSTEKGRLSGRSDSAGDHHSTSHSRDMEKDPELDDDSQRTKSDPEAMQLVREIFFS